MTKEVPGKTAKNLHSRRVNRKMLYMHYSCANFTGDPGGTEISYIVVLREQGLVQRFDARESSEVDALKRLARFVRENQDCQWIGWRFLRSVYGFTHFGARYHVLTVRHMPMPSKILDLKDKVIEMYGSDFAAHPRLVQAAINNGITTLDLMDPDESKKAFDAQDWAKLRANTDRRAAIIQGLYRKFVRGEFVTGQTSGRAAASHRSKPKKSTERGDGECKLIAALLKHHAYADDGAFIQEAIGNNQLARLAGVSASTASIFFRKRFKGHRRYVCVCAEYTILNAMLKSFDQGTSIETMYPMAPPGASDRHDDE